MRPRPWTRPFTALPALLIPLALASARPAAAQHAVEGVWEPVSYELAGGAVHDVDGRIFFVDGQWQVLFLVMDGKEPVRGSAEGGSYQIEGDRLTFRHRYSMAAGDATAGLDAQPLALVSRGPAEEAPLEPTRIELDGDRLTIHFPSGNRMRFRR